MELELVSDELSKGNNMLTDKNMYLQATQFYNDASNPNNEFKAYRLFKEAAKRGYMPAQIALGRLYETGYGTEYNPKESAFWYNKAIRQGSDEAMVNLALLKMQGDIEEDYQGAKELLERAHNMNNPNAGELLEQLQENKPINRKQTIAVILIVLSIIPWAMFSIPLITPILASMGIASIKMGFFVIIALAPAAIMLFLVNTLLED